MEETAFSFVRQSTLTDPLNQLTRPTNPTQRPLPTSRKFCDQPAVSPNCRVTWGVAVTYHLIAVGYLPTAGRVDPSEQSSFTGWTSSSFAKWSSHRVKRGRPGAQAQVRAQARSKLAGSTDTGSPSQRRPPSPAALLVRPGSASHFNQARIAHMADASQPGGQGTRSVTACTSSPTLTSGLCPHTKLPAIDMPIDQAY